jgi:predicted ATPase
LDKSQYVSEILLKKENILSYKDYPFSIPAVSKLDSLALHPKVTFLIGENGAGKSTLLEAIAIAFGFNPEGGSKHFTFSTRESHSSLHEHIVLCRGVKRPRDSFFLRAESFYNVATNVDDLGVGEVYGEHSLHEQSHGESFMSLFLNRFKGKGFYILDEPEAALSPMRQLSFISRLHQLAADDSQFIIATHSPIILSYPNSWIYNIDESGLHKIAYEQTDHFMIHKHFFNNHNAILKELMQL